MSKRFRDLAEVEGVTCESCMREAWMDYAPGVEDYNRKIPARDERKVRALLARPCFQETRKA